MKMSVLDPINYHILDSSNHTIDATKDITEKFVRIFNNLMIRLRK